ncbi:MAG: lipoyl protein ligase domain-containing protein [Acidimicrobiales bacterium]
MVLGSTQPGGIVDPVRAASAGISVVRRRTGGGAVLLLPGDHLWVDAWLPRDDPLWRRDVSTAAHWVGRWWSEVLRAHDVPDVAVHAGPIRRTRWSDRVCFAGMGPGEVTASGQKVVGIAQWRSREGALFHVCAYRHWDPVPLVDVLSIPPGERDEMRSDLRSAAVGLDELMSALPSADEMARRLPPGRPWSVEGVGEG